MRDGVCVCGTQLLTSHSSLFAVCSLARAGVVRILRAHRPRVEGRRHVVRGADNRDRCAPTRTRWAGAGLAWLLRRDEGCSLTPLCSSLSVAACRSVGVIIFLLVCGYPPFNGDSQERIFKKIKRGKFRFPKSSEAGGVSLSDSVKSLITELLQMQPRDRLTAEDALKHPWISGDAAPDAPLPSAVVDALGAFRSKMRLKKAVARVLAHHMTEDDSQQPVLRHAPFGRLAVLCFSAR